MKTSWKMVILILCLLGSLLIAGLSTAARNASSAPYNIFLPLVNKNFDSSTRQLGMIVTNPNNYNESYIYSISENGNDPTNLTITPTTDLYYAWSPDGSKIAFNAYWGGDENIYVMNADGSGLTQLTSEINYDSFSTWSPDGSQLAFYSRRSGSSQIYVMNSDGTDVQQLTDCHPSCISPLWAPVGKKIIFDYDGITDNQSEIYSINSDGTGLLNLTNNAYYDSASGWSPDGSKILFYSNRDHGGMDNLIDIYTMNSDGSDPLRLTTNGYIARVAWSPTGTKIAYWQYNGPMGLFIINPDGSDLVELLCQSLPIDTIDFTWSPDASKIAFSHVSFTPDTRGIYIARLDNSSCTHITTLQARSPKWRPLSTP
ncbi:MAG TPA: hypothetical protein VLD65_04815 [Anaerolineales bacterium]|nr:hypothetical protein [Anaerolineales bacterium]